MREKVLIWVGHWLASWADIFCGACSVITFCTYRPSWDFTFRVWWVLTIIIPYKKGAAGMSGQKTPIEFLERIRREIPPQTIISNPDWWAERLYRWAIAAHNTEKDQRITELEAKLERVGEVRTILENAPELNPSNYDHDQVCELNSAMVEATLLLRAILEPQK